MKADDAKRLKELERQNRSLKAIVADQALEVRALKDVASGKLVSQARRRQTVAMLRDRLGFSERWACRVCGQHRSTELTLTARRRSCRGADLSRDRRRAHWT